MYLIFTKIERKDRNIGYPGNLKVFVIEIPKKELRQQKNIKIGSMQPSQLVAVAKYTKPSSNDEVNFSNGTIIFGMMVYDNG